MILPVILWVIKTRDPGCKEVIRQAWEIEVRGFKSYQLVVRLAETRRKLAKWNKEVFGFCKDKLALLEKLLSEIQGRPPSSDSRENVGQYFRNKFMEVFSTNNNGLKSESAIVFSDNVGMELRGEIKGLLGYRDLNRSDKFLGNPILLTGSKVRDFGFLVDKMARRIEGWKFRLLSLAGRTTLIQSVALNVPIYTMSSFLIPKSICTALDKLVRRFWLKGSDDSSRFLALANWDSICVPKRWGGLSFKKFEDLNFALVAKLGWNLAAGSNAVWCQVFKDKYFRRSSSFWSASKSSSWSYGARSIMATREFIQDESCFMIRNGDLVDIWHSPWLPGYGWERYEASFNPRIREKGVRVSSLFTPESGGWNREALETWFLPGLVKDALEVPRLPLVAKDELFWKSAPDDSMAFDDNLDLVKWLVNPWGTPLSGSDIAKFSTYAISLCFPPSLEQQGQALLQVEDIWGGHWTDVNVFVDAAIRGDFGIIAILVLDRSGVMIETATAKRKASSPFAAELEAFHWGCYRILQSGWHNASLFSDFQQVVKGLAAGFSSEWRARALFDDTLSLLNQMPSCHYHWIPRRSNSGAHNLAAWAASCSSFKFFSSREVAPFVATMNLGC
ncbi:hypothetical protein F8388_016411 [Cannabis sativa]|uniref:RNase H type-1 domain-containing protein n=1 Tax=Cannabis sativa TaxID=3483 RepID=A0A7J6ETP9_CANSA|nr:hypothetical protein G4B88_015942 [Cannabis sativa]KAF4386159.1 hypothetical protein F8388_016411 [Cannabis sativa]